MLNTQPPKQPRLVCWQDGPRWHIGVEAPEEVSDQLAASATQGDCELEPCFGASPLRWQLANLVDEVVVSWAPFEGGELITARMKPPRNPIFKLSQQLDYRAGRMVATLSRGCYLLLGEQGAGRVFAGAASPSPEDVSIPGYQAFVVYRDGHELITYERPDGRREGLPCRDWPFALKGKELLETIACEQGPLFVGTPPVLTTPEPANWSSIGKVVVGVEGRGQRKWREWFIPDAGHPDQALPEHIDELGSGWFFVRIYDRKDELLDSLNFRYLRDLTGVDIVPDPLIPGESGHMPVKIIFRHHNGLRIDPSDELTRSLRLETHAQSTTAVVPPDETIRGTHWHVLTAEGPPVEIRVDIPRIWWALEPDDDAEPQWSATPLRVRRKDFRATSRRRLLIRLPPLRERMTLRVGFDPDSAQQLEGHPWQVVHVSLCNFAGSAQLDNHGDVWFFLWATSGRSPGASVRLLISPAVRLCRYCKMHFNSDQDSVSHLLDQHINDVFPLVDYNTISERDRSLPKEIYLCGYPGCNHYVKVDHGILATSAHQSHFEASHRGDTSYKMRIIHDVEEIKRHVIPGLRVLRRCAICGAERDSNDLPSIIEHLRKHIYDSRCIREFIDLE